MNKATKKQQAAYRKRLCAEGMPRVYAWIASEYAESDITEIMENGAKEDLLYLAFAWYVTDEGFGFWSTIVLEFMSHEARI